jgi:hypothetical protein
MGLGRILPADRQKGKPREEGVSRNGDAKVGARCAAEG